jgi:uncharacterized short protein YbdD (DUF466 family)
MGGADAEDSSMIRWFGAAWRYLRAVSGDDAYERYLMHHAEHHAGEPLVAPKDFFNDRQHRKWTGVSRCC